MNVSRSAMPKLPRLWWFPYTENAYESVRAVTEVMAQRELGAKAKAAAKLTTSAIRALREKL